MPRDSILYEKARARWEYASHLPSRSTVRQYSLKCFALVYPVEVLREYWRVDALSRQSLMVSSHSFAPSPAELAAMAEGRDRNERRANQARARLERMATEHGVDLDAMADDIAFVWHNWSLLELE